MLQSTPEYLYVTGQYRPSFNALFQQYQLANERVLLERTWKLELRYGPHPRQTCDLCLAQGSAKANLVYLHAGYWQSRDKAQFRFIASALSAAGYNVILLNYPLCPEVTVEQIVAAVGDGVCFSRTVLAPDDRQLPLILAGHSAGGHLAVELALAQRELPAQQRPISAIVPISGIYDLAPLVDTSLNAKLRLSLTQAQAWSPLSRVHGELVPAAFIVGADETPAFLQQNRHIRAAWNRSGSPSSCLEVTGRDHFTVLQEFQGPGGALFEVIETLAASSRYDLGSGKAY